MQKIIYRDMNVTIFQSSLFQCNTTVIHTDDFVMAVDPAWLPDEILNIKQYVDSIRGRKPFFLVYTHSDYSQIIGHGAFDADKVFATKAFSERNDTEDILERIFDFDQSYYVDRPYQVTFPSADFLVSRDGVMYRHGRTKINFYTAPGHTSDSMLMVVWQLGLCIAGGYLCSSEFPIIKHSSVEYENTLHKIPQIHDRNWFTRLVPAHGFPALTMEDWLRRRIESLAYIYAVRESIATGVPISEESLWERYAYPKTQQEYHHHNVALMTREFEQGVWEWDRRMSEALFQRKKKVRWSDLEPVTKFEPDEEGDD